MTTPSGSSRVWIWAMTRCAPWARPGPGKVRAGRASGLPVVSQDHGKRTSPSPGGGTGKSEFRASHDDGFSNLPGYHRTPNRVVYFSIGYGPPGRAKIEAVRPSRPDTGEEGSTMSGWSRRSRWGLRLGVLAAISLTGCQQMHQRVVFYPLGDGRRLVDARPDRSSRARAPRVDRHLPQDHRAREIPSMLLGR